MRYRQVHLDFHTSEAIQGIGSKFSKSQFQAMLQRGYVDSITIFSKCHHGWAYHPSTANERHPHLDFDLLGAQIEAAHEIDVKTPVYISAGLDEKEARRHPEWLIRDANDRMNWADTFLKPGYHQFCLNTPYLDILIAQIEEVVQNYDADGIFLDIVGVRTCVCHTCLKALLDAGEDPRDPAAMLALGEKTYANYTRRANEAVHKHKPGLPVFHNGGHIRRGRRDLAQMNTHLELESLPTGGWGYDHFPLSARYAATLGMPYLGMTGKFHTTWGEFGGYKHPNALLYEAALNLANGACVSIGDQLHPEGMMDPATYNLIGYAYGDVAEKEAWCVGAKNIADIALLSSEATGGRAGEGQTTKTGKTDAGAVRILLEGKFLFDVVDLEQALTPYKVVILPDVVRVDEALKERLDAYCASGGRLLVTGESGLNPTGDAFALDLGVAYDGTNEFRPAYYHHAQPLSEIGLASYVFYTQGQKVTLTDGGTALGTRENSYFNREFDHFCSHQHTPGTMQPAGSAMVESTNGIYFAWPAFEEYATKGSLIAKQAIVFALNQLLGQRKTLFTDLPAQGIVTLTEQPDHSRLITHLLYAAPVKRGDGVEVIEDIVTLRDVTVEIHTSLPVRRVVLVPEGIEIEFTRTDTYVGFTIPSVECHQMVELDYSAG